jgi:Na+-driven multidrug efflux pump
MQLTNALVSISCNRVLHHTGGDLYVSVMTIVISVRQIMDTPIMAIADGAAPVLSFNYGAGKFKRVREAVKITALLGFAYTASAWILILTRTDLLISIFSSDTAIGTAAEEAIHLYFSAFVFQTLQYVGQTTFKALARKRQAIFFSLLRKAVIVVPLTYLLPYVFHLGARGVFLAEPFSNVIGGTACFTSMMLTVMRKLKRMEDQA